MDKKPYEKWWCWIIASIMFFVVIQILFTIEAPCKWLEAKWGAGDIISFAGTIVLGFIAISQTQYANQINKKLLEMQREDYLPLLEITGLVGVTKHQFRYATEDFDKKVSLHEMRDAENSVYLGYSVALKVGDLDLNHDTFCRSYEMHCKYSGKLNIKSLSLNSLIVDGNNMRKEFSVQGENLMSLTPGEEQSFFFFLVSNMDFQDEESDAYKIISAHNMSLNVTMTTFDGKTYKEEISVVKHLVKEPEKRFNMKNVEFPVSVTYDVSEKH